MKQINSVITTLPKEQHSRIGTPVGGRGLATRANSEIAEWLAPHKPADVDKAAVSRALQHGVGLRVRYEGRYPTGPNGERMPSYEIAVGCVVDGTEAQRIAARDDLINFQTPADKRTIEAWVAELSVICAKRQDDEFAESLRLEAYASRLAQYPADVARTALLKTTWKFFPTWAELEKVCEALAAPRKHMIHALSQPVEKPEPERRPATEAEKARIQELINKQFPNISQAWRDRAVDEAMQGNCMTGDA